MKTVTAEPIEVETLTDEEADYMMQCLGDSLYKHDGPIDATHVEISDQLIERGLLALIKFSGECWYDIVTEKGHVALSEWWENYKKNAWRRQP